MVGKCANPSCDVPFRYFRNGKLFRFEFGAPTAQVRAQADAAGRRRIEDFWLCGSCASKMTLVSEDAVGVRTRLLRHSVSSLTVSIEEAPLRLAGS